MIFADKIIKLRKRNGWSQEELAEKMNVSRQAISKWEGAQSVPDIEKMLQLSQLFGVTTDYLLKDEIESEEYTDDNIDSSVRKVSLAEADTYLRQRKEASKKIAAGTFLCIFSPIPLLILISLCEVSTFAITENLATAIGLISLFLIVVVAVVIFLLTGFKNSEYEFLDKEVFENEYGVKGMVQEKQKLFRNVYVRNNVIGSCLCVLSPVPIFAGLFAESVFITVLTLAGTMIMAGIGVVFFILAGVPMAGMQRILKEGEFSASEIKKNRVKETISATFWLLAVAIYLCISFVTEDWGTTWIVWPVAGVLYAAVAALSNLINVKEDK